MVAAIFWSQGDNSWGNNNQYNGLSLQRVVHLKGQCWEGKNGYESKGKK